MNRDAIGAIGEIIGAGAVVLSVAYVASQFRKASTQTTHDIYQQTVNNFSSSPENADLVYRGSFQLESLSDSERYHYGMLLSNFFNAASLVWEQRQQRAVSGEALNRIMGVAYFYYSTPGGKAFWEGELSGIHVNRVFPPGFVHDVEGNASSVFDSDDK